MSTRQDRIRATLTERFAPSRLEVVDDSARHAGHQGAAPGGETHYSVAMTAPSLRGLNRLARSRAVHAALAEELATGLHALALHLRAPEEDGA
ncbi:MAG: BolA family transcriptional regulator [Rhodospirillales bacterium]|nr:BolA family transcriptional regulator [Rhodospirillales bacterium]